MRNNHPETMHILGDKFLTPIIGLETDGSIKDLIKKVDEE